MEEIQKLIADSDATLPDWAKTAVLAAQLVSQINRNQLWDAASNDRAEFLPVTYALDTARNQENAIKIPFSFKSFKVESATDSSTEVRLVRGRNFNGAFSMAVKQNDANNFRAQNEGWLYWDAQAGKSITILFAVDADFRPGSLVTEQNGAVTIGEGTSITTAAVGTATTTAAAIVAADTDRKITVIQNQGTVPVYFGGSTVTASGGARPGFKVNPGESIQWRNSAALYAITDTVSNANLSITNEA
jgi:Tfp pilus assembly major pilin PilA